MASRNSRVPPELRAWVQSAAWRQIASEQAKVNLALIRQKPRCCAKAKGSGNACRQPAQANGKCYWHGGRTPKGKSWHRPSYPKGAKPTDEQKLQRKLRDLERAQAKRERWLANMSSDKRAAYRRWLRAHDPNVTPAERHRRRIQAAEAKALLTLMSDDGKPCPDILALAETIHVLEVEAKRLRAEIRAAAVANPPRVEFPNEGIFG